MRIKLFERYWNLVKIHMPTKFGLCDPPDKRGKKIRICSSLRGQHKLEILIHEMLHGCDFYKDELWIKTAARDITNVLWRLGYRETDGGEVIADDT